MTDLLNLPNNLPMPIDDGACQHLNGLSLPSLALETSDGDVIDLAELTGLTVIYIFPMMADPNKALPLGWNDIPGARGCTPQSCSFRDFIQPLRQLNATVFGLSNQSTTALADVKQRLGLPYLLISDQQHQLTKALKLPIFTIGEQQFIKRITLICQNNKITKVFYPVFPPDKSAQQVIAYLESLEPA